MICDLAETYGIFDYHGVPVRLLGTLVSGLGRNSRVRTKREGREASIEAIMLAELYDLICEIVWARGGKKGTKPKSALEVFELTVKEEKKSDVVSFASIEEFERTRNQILKGFEEWQQDH